MGSLQVTGIEGISLSLEEIAELPDEIIDEMLFAGGQVVAAAQRKSIEREGLIKTGLMRDSIKADTATKLDGKGGSVKRVLYVRPRGTHHKTKEGKIVTNEEIAFVHEFGAPKRNIKATQFMKKANEESAAETTSAETAVYDKWLKSKNL